MYESSVKRQNLLFDITFQNDFDVARKKDKFAGQKLALETESKALADRLAEARLVEEGIR